MVQVPAPTMDQINNSNYFTRKSFRNSRIIHQFYNFCRIIVIKMSMGFFALNFQSLQKMDYYFTLPAQTILQRIRFRTIVVAAFIQPSTRCST